MKRSTKSRNVRLTSEKDRRKQYIIKNVVKRGRSVALSGVARWMWRLTKIACAVAFFWGVYWCATTGFHRLFWDNPDYALKDVRFATDGSLTREQAIATAGFKEGRNIFSYNIEAAREALKALPQVDGVEIRRYLPSRIEVAVMERKPVAWLIARQPEKNARPARTHLVDAGGLVFKPKRILPEYEPLPVIAGVELEDLAPGRPVRTAEFMVALELLRRARETGELKVQAVDVAKGYCIVAKDQKGAEITFGLDDLDKQLRRLTLHESEAVKLGRDLRTVNLMVAHNTPVTFMALPEPDHELEELLNGPQALDDEPKTRLIGAEPAKKPATPRRVEPARPREPREPVRKENDSLLKRFRA